MTEPELLFYGGDLRLALEAHREKMLTEIDDAAEGHQETGAVDAVLTLEIGDPLVDVDVQQA
jgi:hypothetical protein